MEPGSGLYAQKPAGFKGYGLGNEQGSYKRVKSIGTGKIRQKHQIGPGRNDRSDLVGYDYEPAARLFCHLSHDFGHLGIALHADKQNAVLMLVVKHLFHAGGVRLAAAIHVTCELADASSAPTLLMLIIPVVMVVLMLKGWDLIGTLVVCDLIGFVLCLVMGFVSPEAMFSAAGPIGAGLSGMLSVICFSFFMFALLEMLTRSGVFGQLLDKCMKLAKTPRQAEVLTVFITVIGGVAIGAASVSILFVGPVVHQIMQMHGIERTRGSNLLDGFGTAMAGIVPYNPVGLNTVSLAIASGVVSSSFSFLDYLPYLFHSYLIMILLALSIITGIGRKFEVTKKNEDAPEA